MTNASLTKRVYTILLHFLVFDQIVTSTRASKCKVIFDLSICLSNTQTTSSKVNTTCQKPSSSPPQVCHKEYVFDFVPLEPYTPEIVVDSVRRCCGPCLKYSIGNTYNSISNIPHWSNSTSHFVFPVLGKTTAKILYGYYFIPLIEPPNLYHVSLKGGSVMANLIIECLNMWPLVINCSFMIIIAGFLGWLMETWGNKDDFPRPFISGWFEGIWWAYISMTTVGYGDKSPKSVQARLFAVIWILIGITTFSLVTAMLSSELTKANSIPAPEVEGAKVGALPNRLYDSMIVAKHGGTLVMTPSKDTIRGIYDLVDGLRKGDIDGFVVDRYVILMVYRHLQSSDPGIVNFLKTKTIRSELPYTGEALSYGFLVKDLDDYEYLVDFVNDNKNIINTCNTLLINQLSNEAKDGQVPTSIFTASGGAFWPTFNFLVTTIALITCFGFCYEVHRRRGDKSKGDMGKEVTVESNQHEKAFPKLLSLTSCLTSATYYIEEGEESK